MQRQGITCSGRGEGVRLLVHHAALHCRFPSECRPVLHPHQLCDCPSLHATFLQPFSMDEPAVFLKFELFTKRLNKLIDMFTTIHQFSSLEQHTHITGECQGHHKL